MKNDKIHTDTDHMDRCIHQIGCDFDIHFDDGADDAWMMFSSTLPFAFDIRLPKNREEEKNLMNTTNE